MKTNLIPKLFSLITLLLLPTAHADDPRDTMEEFQAQVGIIRDSVSATLRDIENSPRVTDFKCSDYWKALPSFKKSMANALSAYESAMGNQTSGFLGKVALHVEKYNTVVRSKAYSETQKIFLVKALNEHLEQEDFQGMYERAILKAYRAFFPSKDKMLSLVPFYTADNDAAEESIEETVMKGCESQICVSLRAADFTLALQMITSRIDRDLTVTYLDGTSMTFKRTGGPYGELFAGFLEYIDASEMPFETH